MKMTVLLVDDHQLVRKGFRRILEDDPDIQVVGEAGTGVEAIQMAEKFGPRVVVMDMAMPGLDGVQATREILKKAPSTAVLILSMYSEENYIRNAFDAGAKGYLLKNAIEVDLTAAVKTVATGRRYASGLSPGAGPPAGWVPAAHATRKASLAAHCPGPFQQGDCRTASVERQYRFGASRQLD